MNGVVYFNVVVAVLLGVIGAKVAFADGKPQNLCDDGEFRFNGSLVLNLTGTSQSNTSNKNCECIVTSEDSSLKVQMVSMAHSKEFRVEAEHDQITSSVDTFSTCNGSTTVTDASNPSSVVNITVQWVWRSEDEREISITNAGNNTLTLRCNGNISATNTPTTPSTTVYDTTDCEPADTTDTETTATETTPDATTTRTTLTANVSTTSSTDQIGEQNTTSWNGTTAASQTTLSSSTASSAPVRAKCRSRPPSTASTAAASSTDAESSTDVTNLDTASGNIGTAPACSCTDVTEKFMYIILAIVVVALVFDTVLAIFLVRKVRCKCCHEKAKAQDPHQAEQAFKPERQPRRPILGDYCEVELLDDPVMRQQSSGVICGLQTASENGGKGEKKADGDSPDSYPYSKPSKRRPSPDAKEKTTVETEEMKMAQRNPDSFYFILEADPEAEERAIDVTFINPRNPIDIASVDKANESSDNPEAKGKGEAIKAQNAGWQKKRGKPKQARGQIARSGDLRRHSTNVYENVQLTSFNETDADIPLRKSQRIATRLQPQVFGSLPDLADLPSNGKVNVSPKVHTDHTDKVAPRSACVERQNGGNKRGPGLAKQHVVNETDEDPVMIDNLVYQSADETAPRSNGNLRLHNNRGQRALSGGVYELAKAVDGEDVSITQDVYRNVKQPRPAGRKGNGGARKQRGGDATYANTSSLLLAL